MTAKKKILILQEYVRVDHVKTTKDGTSTLDFMSSPMGIKLKKKLKTIDILPTDITVEYIYDKVPEPKSVNNRTGKPVSYKDPKISEVSPRFPYLDNLIVTEKYDMVIPSGKLGCKYLLNDVKISKLRGVPERKDFKTEAGEHSTWVFPMFSMEYLAAQPNNELIYDADLASLSKYIDLGDDAFKPADVKYEYATDINRVTDIFKYIEQNRPITAWDLETNTLRADLPGARALVVSISWAEQQGVTIPIEHKDFTWKPEELKLLLEMLATYVASKELIKVLHNGHFDIHFLMSAYKFVEFENNRDTKVAYYLTTSQENKTSFKLSDLAYEMTDMGGYDKPLDDWKKTYIKEYKTEHKDNPVNEVDGENFSYEWFPLEDMLVPYASGDVDCCLRIYNKLWEKIQTRPQWVYLFTEFYPRLVRTLARMEATGFHVDTPYLEDIDDKYADEVDRLTEEIRKDPSVQELEEEHQALYERGLEEWMKPKDERDPVIAKFRDKYKKKLEFNPNSSEDKGRVLYDLLAIQLPPGKETVKDSASRKKEDELEWMDYKADTNALEWIIENVEEAKPLALVLREHSKVKTLRNNFTSKMRKLVIPEKGTLHGNFNETGTATSRLSSNNVNFQNIPSSHQKVERFDYAYPIKRSFDSRFEGGAIGGIDYSALEMRVLGLIAGDKGMTQAFLDGKDLHRNTASIVWGMEEEEVTGDQRSAAKSVSFGLVYGESASSLAPKLGLTRGETEAIFEKYFQNKPQIRSFIEDTHTFAKANGYVDTMQGHRRLIMGAMTKEGEAEALRQSVNTIIQGTGAYLTNMALILIDDYLLSTNKRSRLVASVHDSIVIDMPPEEAIEVMGVAKFIMENLPIDFLNIEWKGETIRYPIRADAEMGTSYKDLVDYDPDLFAQFKSVKGYTKYFKDLGKFEDYEASKLISKEQLEEGQEMVENQIEHYKLME